MSSRAAILKQQPLSGVAVIVPAPEHEEIAAILHEVVAKGGIQTRDDARIAAFASYNGVGQETVIDLFRRRGTADILRLELGDHRQPIARGSDIISASVFRRLSTFMLARELNQPDLGWALVVLTVAEDADFHAITECLSPRDDPSRIASFFLGTPRFTPPGERGQVLAKLLEMGDTVSIAVASALIQWWIEVTVQVGEMDLGKAFSAIEQYPVSGAILLGSVIGSTARYRSPRVFPELVRRADVIDGLIDQAGKKVFASGTTINRALGTGIRDIEVLSAISRWSADPEFAPAASKALRHTVGKYLEGEFSSRQKCTADQAAHESHPTHWSVDPLVVMASRHGIEVDIFENYFNDLATDSLSQMTRNRLFLQDRQRAILLLAVAGLVAHNRVDIPLLDAVRSAASRLELQPPGAVEVLDSLKREEFAAKCGFILPIK